MCQKNGMNIGGKRLRAGNKRGGRRCRGGDNRPKVFAALYACRTEQYGETDCCDFLHKESL